MKLEDAIDFRLGSQQVSFATENATQFTFWCALALTISKVLAGAKKLVKKDSNTLTLSAANTFTGGTEIHSGTLAITNATALGPSGNITFLGGTLQYPTNTVSTNYAARIKNSTSPVAIEVVTAAHNVVMNSPLDSSNTAGIYKTGVGLLTSQADNGISGKFESNYGNLILQGNNANCSEAVSSGASGQITIYRAGSLGSATWKCKSSSGTTIFNHIQINTAIAGFTFSNPIEIDTANGRCGVISQSSNNLTLSSAVSILGTGTLGYIVFQNGGSSTQVFTVSGSITGSSLTGGISFRGQGSSVCTGALNFPGAVLDCNCATGFWTFFKNAANSYTQTQIAGTGTGGFKCGENDAFLTTKPLNFSNTAANSFDLNGFNQTFAGVYGTSGATNLSNALKNSSATTSTLTLSGLTTNRAFYGTISGPMNLTLNSSGRQQTLSGSNGHTGTTTITAGTLVVGSILSGTSGKLSSATFTPTTLTVAFSVAPVSSDTFRFFGGSTSNTYNSVTLTNGGGLTGYYYSPTSTLSFIPPAATDMTISPAVQSDSSPYTGGTVSMVSPLTSSSFFVTATANASTAIRFRLHQTSGPNTQNILATLNDFSVTALSYTRQTIISAQNTGTNTTQIIVNAIGSGVFVSAFGSTTLYFFLEVSDSTGSLFSRAADGSNFAITFNGA